MDRLTACQLTQFRSKFKLAEEQNSALGQDDHAYSVGDMLWRVTNIPFEAVRALRVSASSVLYQITVWFVPIFHTVPLVGDRIGGTNTSRGSDSGADLTKVDRMQNIVQRIAMRKAIG